MAQISCLGTKHFKISQDGIDRFTWPPGQVQGVIDFIVERLRPGGLPYVNDFTIVPFHGGSDAHLVGQPLPDCRPTVVDSLASQADANAVQNMIRQNCYEQMAVAQRGLKKEMPASGRPGASAGPGGLLVLRSADDRSVSQPSQRHNAGIHKHGMGNTTALPKCQTLPGDKVDEAMGDLLMEVMTPMALEVSLAVQQEIQRRFEEADKLRLRQVERCRYDADFAKRQYMKVDPENRLIAEELEAEWNVKADVITANVRFKGARQGS